MRILYSHRIQSRDGQSVHLEELVAALRRAGHEVLVVGPRMYDQAHFGGESRLISFLRNRLPGFLGEAAELAYNLVAYLRLRRACRDFRPDFIYERYNLFYVAGALLARRHRLKFYVEVNSPLADERRRGGGLQLERIARRLERFVWCQACRTVVVTGVLRDLLVAQGGIPERMEVVPNGIDKDKFLAIPSRQPVSGEVVLGFVGFVRAWHGLDRVLHAMADDATGPDLRLVVVGDGPARRDLERLTEELRLSSRVHFTGLVGRNEVPTLLEGFDIALQPSVVPYASPLKVFEYMAAGRAIVAPDQPNIREILAHENTALLYDPAQKEMMWRQIVRLAESAELRRQLGQAARAEIIRRDYSWDGNAARLIAWATADLAASGG